MISYLLIKLFSMAVVIFSIVTTVFILTRLVPADPARMVAGLEAGPEQVAQVRKELGLDKPVWEQYWIYVRNLARLDLGNSIRTQQPVSDDLERFAPASFELATLSMIILLVLSIPLGILTATTGKIADSLIRFVAILGAAVPTFWLALVLQIVFYGWLRVLPAGGRLDLQITPPPLLTGMYLVDTLAAGQLNTFLEAAKHLILPVTALVLGRLGLSVRLVRGLALEQMSKDYVRTARAKGLREHAVLYKHMFRNTLIPVVTLFGVQFGYLLGGSFLVEVIFLWPGMGRYAVDAIGAFDYNSVIGVTLVVAIYFTLINFLLDLSYGLLSPQVRRG